MEQNDKAQRFNEGKLKWSLVHFKSLRPLVEVLMFGAKKYAPDNWKKGFDKKELLDSMARHVTALMDGEEFDSESKLHHIGHIMCNAMFYSFHFVITIDNKEQVSTHNSEETLSLSLLPKKLAVNNYTKKMMVSLLGGTDFHDYKRYIDLAEKNIERYIYDGKDTIYTYYKLKT